MSFCIRHDFPLISAPPYEPFCFADSAATTQKPYQVIEAVVKHYQQTNTNVHRGAYRLSDRVNEAYEKARSSVARYYQVSSDSVVFCRSATEALNILVHGLSQRLVKGDGILLSILEHHATIVPWQQAAKRYGFELHWAPISTNFTIDLEAVQSLLDQYPSIKVFSCVSVSNTLGTKQPLSEIFALARSKGVITIADCCQSFLQDTSLDELQADALVASSHKMYGPSGVGVLVTTQELLESLPPYQTGGGMIQFVTKEDHLLLPGPARFEAGTPNIEGAVGFGAALDYLMALDRAQAMLALKKLVDTGMITYRNLGQYQLLAAANERRSPIFSLVHPHIHAHDLATYLDQNHGICARAGHHCTMPLLQSLNAPATLRLSFSLYNTVEEILMCAQALLQAEEFFHV